MRQSTALLALALLAGPPGAAIAAPPIRWDQVVGAGGVTRTPALESKAGALLARAFCYHGCSDTYAACMSRPGAEGATARRVAGYVLRQLDEGRTEEQIEAILLLRARSVHPLDPANFKLDPAEGHGAADAPVVIVEFADFECPFCAEVSPALRRLVDASKGRVRLHFRPFPLKGHPRALPAALAMLAAARQGKQWALHDRFYAHRRALSDADIEKHAETVGLDLARFRTDLRDPALVEVLRQSKREGLENGVDRTPTLFFNGKRYLLPGLSEADLRDRVDEELELIGQPPLGPP